MNEVIFLREADQECFFRVFDGVFHEVKGGFAPSGVQ
jgi:hypothetical protein